MTPAKALAELRAICLALPETSERISWQHPCFLAGKKTFVTFEKFEGRPSIAFRLEPDEVEKGAGRDSFFATPYGRGKWVSLWIDVGFDRRVVRKLAIHAYRGVALQRMIASLDLEDAPLRSRLRSEPRA